MATILDINNPSFVLWPVNNNRTAWRPWSTPVILVVPRRADLYGNSFANSDVFNTRVYIEDVPQEAKVAGHQNIGLRFPDKELYAVSISPSELSNKIINLASLTITKSDGTEVNIAEAQSGDWIHYTTVTGVTDTIEYLVGTDYYDLSDVLLDLELLPSSHYNVVYQTEYFRRILSDDGSKDFVCVDANLKSLVSFKFKIDHPGKVLDEFYRLTPPPYLTNSQKSADKTVSLYRPFTDAIQNVMDEQDLLRKINWVYDSPAEAIPYLSSLLGWDLPYFPESIDQLRRAVLRRTVEFQNLKGSRRAIVNIFRLFGFEILISNLWWSSDGKRLIRPDERLPAGYTGQEIRTIKQNQVETLLANYTVTGFTDLKIPLLFRPQELTELDSFTSLIDGGQITIVSYVVEPDGPAHLALQELSDLIAADPSGYGDTANCIVDADGFLFPQALDEALEGKETIGFSQIHIAGKLGNAVDEIAVGTIIPVTRRGLSFNRETNTLFLTINGNSEFSEYKVYSFAIYRRYSFVVPEALKDLQSNRFDIQVLTEDLAEFADPVILQFAMEFLNRIKAFHSILNAIRTRTELTETYEVTTLCVGGRFTQRHDTDIGRLQVPPAIIPQIPTDLTECSRLTPKALGYKVADLLLRRRKLTNLPEEHAAWQLLDDREVLESGYTRLAPNAPADRDTCKFTHLGQDRIIVQQPTNVRDVIHNPTPNSNMGDSGYVTNQLTSNDVVSEGIFAETGILESSNSDGSAYGSFIRERTLISSALCDLDNATDYCYKGRVEDELLYRPTLKWVEQGGIRPVYVGMGSGVYWSYPIITQVSQPGVRTPDPRGLTHKSKFSGGAPKATEEFYSQSVAHDYLKAAPDSPLPPKNNSLLGRLYRDYERPGAHTIHYSNRRGDPTVDQRQQLALQRPSLEIIKPILHLPGCRFPRLNRLVMDYAHPTHTARPWDFDYCGPNCDTENFLNYEKIEIEGNEQLQFDTVPYAIPGNNLPADIPSLGDHTLGTDANLTAEEVVHKVYMNDATSNPAVDLGEACAYDSSISVDGTIQTIDPLFQSHNTCATDPTIYTDFADGYPCLRGYQLYIPPDLGQDLYDDLLFGLGLIEIDGTDAPAEILFFLGSGIRDRSVQALRLDAGCELVGCDGGSQPICSVDSYLDQYGQYDWEPDHLVVNSTLLAVETVGAELRLLDGSIGTLMETV